MEREREAHRYTVDMDELEDFLRQNKLSFRLPEKVLASQIAKEFVTDIPWDEISKIGDVVILKTTLADLRSKGHI
jgi:sporulation protein YlmC with PRC-barrel domain